MKRTLFAGAIALTVASPAFAADLPAGPPPQAPAAYVPVQAPVYNWGGVYIGANGGSSYMTQAGTTNTITSSGASVGTGPAISAWGFAAGGQIGANFQMNQIVFGVEADADYLSNSTTVTVTDPSGLASASHQFQLDVLSTVRGRLGFAVDRILLYGTGGLAMGEYEVTRTQLTGMAGTATPNTVENVSDLRLGWVAGGGLEWAFSDNWTARAEYLYANLESVTDTYAISNRTQVAPTMGVSMVRAGLNFKFGGF
jgi:outer membrane immunogenic protein